MNFRLNVAAIIINTILYSATHFYKGVQEVIGAIPLGIVLCLLTIDTGISGLLFLLICVWHFLANILLYSGSKKLVI